MVISKRVIESVTRESLPLPVTGLVLAGGKSERMGRPKAFLPFQGTSMIEHVLGIMRGLFNEIFLVANEPAEFETLGVDVVKDILPYRGPLGGILSGLLVSSNPHAFVIACDMPLMQKRMMREIASRRHGNDVVVLAHHQGIEPLVGVYSKNCIKQLEESLFAGDVSVQDFLGGLKAEIFQYKDEASKDILPPYFNIDTPQDYSRVITGAPPAVRPFPEENLSRFMNARKIVSLLFYIAALYDFGFGIIFLFAGERIFSSLHVTAPNHWGYIQFPALVMLIFAVMFYQVAQKPEQNRNLIPYGVMLKFSYASVIFWHWSTGSVPAVWKPFAIADLLFLVGFLWAMNHIAKTTASLQTY